MNLPIQAQPVNRQVSTAKYASSITPSIICCPPGYYCNGLCWGDICRGTCEPDPQQ